MTYVITEACIDVKDGTCVDVCPVDCIYEGGRMFYLQPDECVNCGNCVSVCPVKAIYADDRLPAAFSEYVAVNREFLATRSPAGASPAGFPIPFAATRIIRTFATGRRARPEGLFWRRHATLG